jgi:hypothetical protein
MRERTPNYRNDELLRVLHERLNSGHEKGQYEDHPFFTTIAFECDVDAALSWTLTTEEAKRIHLNFYEPGHRSKLSAEYRQAQVVKAQSADERRRITAELDAFERVGNDLAQQVERQVQRLWWWLGDGGGPFKPQMPVPKSKYTRKS